MVETFNVYGEQRTFLDFTYLYVTISLEDKLCKSKMVATTNT